MNGDLKLEIEALRAELKKQKNLAAIEIPEATGPAMNGLLGRRRAALEAIPKLRKDLADKIIANSNILIQTRDLGDSGIEDVKEKALEDSSILLLDYLFVENLVLSKVFGNKPGKMVFESQSVDAMTRELQALANKFGGTIPPLMIQQSEIGIFSNRDMATMKLEMLMEKAFGLEFKPLFFKALVAEAVEENEDVNAYNVVIFNVPFKAVDSFRFNRRVQVVKRVAPAAEKPQQPQLKPKQPKKAEKNEQSEQ